MAINQLKLLEALNTELDKRDYAERAVPKSKVQQDRPSDIPDDSGNADKSADTVDANPLHADLTPNLTEGHIAGTGQGVAKRGAAPDEDAVSAALINKFSKDTSMSTALANWLEGGVTAAPLRGLRVANNTAAGMNPFLAAALYGGAGYFAHKGFKTIGDKFYDRDPDEREKMKRKNIGLKLGLGAAALGGVFSHLRQKTASYGVNALEGIALKLSMDDSMSMSQKSKLMQAVGTLSSSETNSLFQLLAMVGGAGIGAAVVRFLLGAGKAGMIGGTIIGAMLGGNALGAGTVGNASHNGFTVNNTVDIFGRTY